MLLSKVSDCFQTGFTWASWFQLDFNCMTVWNQSGTLESKAWRASIRLATIEIDLFVKERRENSSETNCVRTGSRKCVSRYGCNWLQVDCNYIMSVESNLVYCTAHLGQALELFWTQHICCIRLLYGSCWSSPEDEPYTGPIQQKCWVQVSSRAWPRWAVY